MLIKLSRDNRIFPQPSNTRSSSNLERFPFGCKKISIKDLSNKNSKIVLATFDNSDKENKLEWDNITSDTTIELKCTKDYFLIELIEWDFNESEITFEIEFQ
jgi:hypothetical protein